MTRSIRLEVASLAETEAFGRHLGTALFPGAVVALIGQLGAGKTHLVRAIAEGLEVRNPNGVNSPTFVLIQEYPARLPIFHFDAYRLSGSEAFLELGVQEYYEAKGVCLIEWADRVEDALPKDYLRIEIDVCGESARNLTLTAFGQEYDRLIDHLSQTTDGREPPF